MTKSHSNTSRRALLGAAATVPLASVLPSSQAAAQVVPGQGDFAYEITRTDAEWRAMLTDLEYAILRHGQTEPRFTSTLIFEEREGHYTCKGCDLPVFDAEWKAPVHKIGWVFWSQARPDSLLTAVDLSFGMADMPKAAIECHCRRCGSHLGHIVNVEGEVLHCINGSALTFHAA